MFYGPTTRRATLIDTDFFVRWSSSLWCRPTDRTRDKALIASGFPARWRGSEVVSLSRRCAPAEYVLQITCCCCCCCCLVRLMQSRRIAAPSYVSCRVTAYDRLSDVLPACPLHSRFLNRLTVLTSATAFWSGNFYMIFTRDSTQC